MTSEQRETGDQPDDRLPTVVVDAGSLLDEAEAIIDAEASRCPAATGQPTIDHPGRCTVHADGAHRCYRAPNHQAVHRDSAPVVLAASPDDLPEWATHECDDGFRWASIGQQPAERYRQRRTDPFRGFRDHAGLGLMCTLCHGPCTIDGPDPDECPEPDNGKCMHEIEG